MNAVLRFGRLCLLPFPLAFAASAIALVVYDRVKNGSPGASPAPIEAGEVIGEAVLYIFAIVLQIMWGAPSLMLLEARGYGFRGYAAAGVVTSVSLSLGLSALLCRPQFGETLGWMFGYTYLFLGTPAFLGYIVAWGTRRRIIS